MFSLRKIPLNELKGKSKWGNIFVRHSDKRLIQSRPKTQFIKWVNDWHRHDGVQDMLCQSMASWHSENFKLKAFEKQYVQGGLSELPSEAGHETLMSDVPSLFSEERNVLIFRTPRPVSAVLVVSHLLHLAHSLAVLSHFSKTLHFSPNLIFKTQV